MPSDYDKIRSDNIEEYGKGKRHLAFLGRLYTDRTHFVFELLQNAEDAEASQILFKLFEDRLEVTHDGRPFNESDVKGVCGIDAGTKAEDLTQIGKFGIGFKSVYAYTTKPEIHSGDESFKIEVYVRPHAVKRRSIGDPWTTLFVFPFDAPSVDPETACQEIGECLCNLNARTLLFLRNIKEIDYELLDTDGVYLREETGRCSARQVEILGQKSGPEENENWLIFERRVTVPDKSRKVPVEVGFRIENDPKDKKERIVRIERSPLIVYFPTEKDTRLRFLINGPYRTTPARDNIPGHDAWNKKLIRETAELVVNSLRQLKEMDLLSVSLLDALPIRMDDFSETSFFYPIFNKVRRALMDEKLLPADDGTFVAARNAKIAGSERLTKLLNSNQLRLLDQTTNVIKWLSSEITERRTHDLWKYLRNELNVAEIDSEMFARGLSEQFLACQSDEWFIEFYEFLSGQKALWRAPRWEYDSGGILRKKPILPLQDDTYVNPFQDDGSPNAYLAVTADINTSFPIVKVGLAENGDVRKFLGEMGVPELDLVAELIERILPKYRDAGMKIPVHEYKSDIEKIGRAYATDSQEKKKRLRKKLLDSPFILAKNPYTAKSVYRKPDQVYFRSEELYMYFSGNDSFACVNLNHPQSALFKHLGVTEVVRIKRRAGNCEKHVIIRAQHSWHERGLDGFDPNIKIDGLKLAIDTPTPQKSAFIWNKIASPNSDCIRGVVEKSSRQTYEGSRREEQVSEFGQLLINTAWLPGPDGNMHKPSELTLDDLPASFVPDEKLADCLGMKKDIVAQLAEEAGISEKSLNLATQIENSSSETRKKIVAWLHGETKEDSEEPEQVNQYAQALSEVFTKPSRSPRHDRLVNGGEVQNPLRRREKIYEDIIATIENESERGQRSYFTLLKRWEGKNELVRVSFVEWYGGRCQICRKTFVQRNGEPYFEGLYLVSRTTAGWQDRVGNVLCLCAEHSAMFQFGPREVEEDIIQQLMQLKVNEEGGDGHLAIQMRLCDEPIEITFAEKHLIDLQEMIRVTQ